EVTREVTPERGRRDVFQRAAVTGHPGAARHRPGPARQPGGGHLGPDRGTCCRRVLGYPGPGGYTVSLVIMVAVSVAAAVVAATVPLPPRRAGSCSPP